jgi:hypothetical protein
METEYPSQYWTFKFVLRGTLKIGAFKTVKIGVDGYSTRIPLTFAFFMRDSNFLSHFFGICIPNSE